MTIKQQGGIFGRNPSFNDVASTSLTSGNIKVEGNTISSENTNGDILLSPNGSGDVSTLRNLGVGTSTPFSSSGKNIEVSDANVSRLIFNNTSTNGNQYAWYSGTSGQAVLYNYTDSVEAIYVNSAADVKVTTGNLVIGTSGKGIDFSATSGTGTSELFDDYEEGTWTPQITDLTNNATMSGNNGGVYTKTGRLVTISAVVETTSLGSMSGGLYISGLPYQPIAFSGAATSGRGLGLNITAGQSVSVFPSTSSPVLFVGIWSATTGTSFMSLAEWSASGRIEFSFSYTTG